MDYSMHTEYLSVCPFVVIGSPPPPPQQERVASPGQKWGGVTLACGEEGEGGSNSDEGPRTLVLYVYYNPSSYGRIQKLEDKIVHF